MKKIMLLILVFVSCSKSGVKEDFSKQISENAKLKEKLEFITRAMKINTWPEENDSLYTNECDYIYIIENLGPTLSYYVESTNTDYFVFTEFNMMAYLPTYTSYTNYKIVMKPGIAHECYKNISEVEFKREIGIYVDEEVTYDGGSFYHPKLTTKEDVVTMHNDSYLEKIVRETYSHHLNWLLFKGAFKKEEYLTANPLVKMVNLILEDKTLELTHNLNNDNSYVIIEQ